MSAHYEWLQDSRQQQTLLLRCHIQPGAKTRKLDGLHDERLKIKLQAPAVDGRANEALIDFLAEQFAVRKADIQLLRGLTSRGKTVLINEPKRLPENSGINRC